MEDITNLFEEIKELKTRVGLQFEEIKELRTRLEPLETKVDDQQLILDRVKGVNRNPISNTVVYQRAKRNDGFGEDEEDIDDVTLSNDEFQQNCPFYFSFSTWSCCCK
jgi:regulator of replication initiation timing